MSGIDRSPRPVARGFSLGLCAGSSFYDFRRLDPERSLVLARRGVRGPLAQMPRLGGSRVDQRRVAALRAFIEHMTPERGYPSAAP